jgi:hypothetical protein
VRKLLRRESFLAKQDLEQRIKRSSPTSIAKAVSWIWAGKPLSA